MRTPTTTILLASLALVAAFSFAVRAQDSAVDGPQYTTGDSLIRPADYREWIFLSSGLGMTYETPAAGAQPTPQIFQNVFVNPSSYRVFMETGAWPDQSIFILELRRSGTDASINRAGRFQTELFALEAEVKDARFPDGWAFFEFGRADALSDAAAPLTGTQAAPCVECHSEHTAVERTFVQFYPTLLDVARDKGTLKPGF